MVYAKAVNCKTIKFLVPGLNLLFRRKDGEYFSNWSGWAGIFMLQLAVIAPKKTFSLLVEHFSF